MEVLQNSNKKQHTKKRLLEALDKSLGIISTACKIAGLNRATYYRYIKEDPEFKEAVEDIAEGAKDYVETQLYKAIQEGNIPCIIFFMKTKCKDRGYIELVEQTNVEHVEQPLFNVSNDDGNTEATKANQTA